MAQEVTEIRTPDGMSEMEDEWNGLLADSEENDLFLTSGWMTNWWSNFGSSHELRLIALREDGKLIALAPFILSKRGRVLGWSKLQFLATGPSDHLGIIVRRGHDSAYAAIFKRIEQWKDWDVLELRELWEHGPTLSHLRSAYPTGEMARGASPFVNVSQGYAAFMASLHKNTRHNLVRYWNKMERELHCRFEVGCGPGEAKRCLPLLKELSLRRWDDEGTSPFSQPGVYDFLESSLGQATGERALFHGIWIEDRPIALVLGFRYLDRYLYYIPAYDPAFANFSPGFVLHSKIIQDCTARGITEVDFLRGAENHKFRFNATDRGLVHFRYIRDGPLRRVEAKAREGRFV